MAIDRPKKKGSNKNKNGENQDSTADDGSILPPFMAYDPAIDAEIRANERGLEDIEQDFTRQKRIDQQDYRQTRKDLKRTSTRGRQDIRRDSQRGYRGFSEQRQDIGRTAQRGAEDFQTRLNGLFREYRIKAVNQAQTTNARGVGDGGSLAASQAKRAANQGIEQTALTLAKSRQDEDIATSLTRLGKDEGEFGRDISRSKTRLGQDMGRERKLAGRDFKRTRRSARRDVRRARREGLWSELDLTDQAIYQARTLKPGAFSRYGKKTGKKK